jgi:hypothetical protein
MQDDADALIKPSPTCIYTDKTWRNAYQSAAKSPGGANKDGLCLIITTRNEPTTGQQHTSLSSFLSSA